LRERWGQGELAVIGEPSPVPSPALGHLLLPPLFRLPLLSRLSSGRGDRRWQPGVVGGGGAWAEGRTGRGSTGAESGKGGVVVCKYHSHSPLVTEHTIPSSCLHMEPESHNPIAEPQRGTVTESHTLLLTESRFHSQFTIPNHTQRATG
jgi:hypothetical protein